MKTAILILIIMLSTNISAQYKPAKRGETNYKEGFSYHDSRGTKCTLIKFVNVGMDYRWKTKFEHFGVVAYGWTDDCWIDLYTGKAYLNEQTHQIVYYTTNKETLK